MDKLVVLLLLVSTFISAGDLALQCYSCTSQTAENCSTTVACPDSMQCVSLAIVVQGGGVELDYSEQNCLPKEFCQNGSLSAAFSTGSFTSTCCTTDLCNKPVSPAPVATEHNGKKCCADQGCTETVNCVGDEDSCFNATVYFPALKLQTRGCATESLCNELQPIGNLSRVDVLVRCCKGDLCNGVGGVTLSLLLTTAPLLSFILVH